VAYPLQAVFYAFRYGALRGFTLLFYLVMCFSAVYLNHHYILDILWGSVYALLVCLALEWLGKRKSA
jgi:membrane-associated phospholipid phosphatase